MADLLRRLEGVYDLILLDAPPLLPVTDAAVLAAETSGAVLIARHGSTTRDQLSRSADALLDGVGARILGTVINMTPKRGPDSYYYGYAYSYRSNKAPKSTVVQTTAMMPKAPSPDRTDARSGNGTPRASLPTSSATNGHHPSRTVTVDELDPIITESTEPVMTAAERRAAARRERLRAATSDPGERSLD
jgi:hypothetical protein